MSVLVLTYIPFILSIALGLYRNWFHPLLCFSFHNPLPVSLSLSLFLSLSLSLPPFPISISPSLSDPSPCHLSLSFLHFKKFTVNLSPALSSLFHSSPTSFQGFAIFNAPSLNYIYLLGAALVRVTVRTVDYPSGEVSGLLQAKSVEQSVFNSKSGWNQRERARERKRRERERERERERDGEQGQRRRKRAWEREKQRRGWGGGESKLMRDREEKSRTVRKRWRANHGQNKAIETERDLEREREKVGRSKELERRIKEDLKGAREIDW